MEESIKKQVRQVVSDYGLPGPVSTDGEYQAVHTALLVQIRDELRGLRASLTPQPGASVPPSPPPADAPAAEQTVELREPRRRRRGK